MKYFTTAIFFLLFSFGSFAGLDVKGHHEGDAKIIRLLLEELAGDNNGDVRMGIARFALKIGGEVGIAICKELLKDRRPLDDALRAYIAEIAGEIGGKAGISLLKEELFEDSGPMVRR